MADGTKGAPWGHGAARVRAAPWPKGLKRGGGARVAQPPGKRRMRLTVVRASYCADPVQTLGRASQKCQGRPQHFAQPADKRAASASHKPIDVCCRQRPPCGPASSGAMADAAQNLAKMMRRGQSPRLIRLKTLHANRWRNPPAAWARPLGAPLRSNKCVRRLCRARHPLRSKSVFNPDNHGCALFQTLQSIRPRISSGRLALLLDCPSEHPLHAGN